MNEERTQSFDEVYQSLGTKEGEKSICKSLLREEKERQETWIK